MFSLSALKVNTDVCIAVGIIGILLVMVLPLPAPVLDLLLAMNLALSLVTLLIALYTLEPLEFAIFPSLLLFLTLFRLALNISSTRLILLHGNRGPDAAGAVIKAFGNFVIGGNFVVGVIVFSILIVINFVVITKGAGRIAEVAARFTLDAMPGKQMAIDADLNAGLINEQQARRRGHGRRQQVRPGRRHCRHPHHLCERHRGHHHWRLATGHAGAAGLTDLHNPDRRRWPDLTGAGPHYFHCRRRGGD